MDGADKTEGVVMGELYYVVIFCAFYSSVVSLSLWLTFGERVKVKIK